MITAPRGIGPRSLAPDFLDAEDAQPRCGTADPERFFGPDIVARATAVTYCTPCPLRDQCRDWALEQGNDLYGVWGGTTQPERKRLRRSARTAA
ncbi:WhiB family transcriptional regulator [Micromonospora sp. NPDC003816]|uniref:WhiB family transcriptional regulator n=1 Tax=Micromonospora sp. NPDC003816 TaxID=3364224 RepID=UPI0036AFFD53